IKNHAFRAGRIETIKGGIVDDNFGSYGEWFAACSWRSFSSIGRDTAIKAADWFESLAGPRTYLYAYGCGGGTNSSAGGVGTTADFTTKPVYAVHTELFGSYFGDWNTRNNFLRAPLASSPYALTCGWAGRPAWYTHHMSLGESIGYSFLLTQNNATIVGGQLGRYTPHVIYNAQGAGSVASIGDRGIHIALMGDPTLRAVMQPVSAMGKVTAATEYPNKVNLSWQRPGNDIEAYMIYRKYNEFSGWELLTPKAITALSFQDSLVNEGNVEYRVHACALRQTASGTYYDMGKFAYATVITTGVDEDRDARSGASLARMGTLELYPNPTSGDVAIEVSVDQEGPCSLSITDVTGRVLWSLHYDQVNIGSFTVRPDAMITSELSAGRYVVTMSGRAGVVSQLLTIRR
ncbi:MAG: T9SS C-terminal target domain-containing protein, partial [Ignavibacteriae bacterium]